VADILQPETYRLVRAAIAVAASLAFAFVGRAVGRRRTEGADRVAQQMFQFWWYGLALLTLNTPLTYAMDRFGVGGFETDYLLFQMVIVVLVAMVGALVYFLLYVYTGRPGVAWPIAIYNLVLLAWLEALLGWAQPNCCVGTPSPGGSENVLYVHQLQENPQTVWLGLALLGPIVVGAVAYFALFFRVEQRIQKFRVAVVAASLVLWIGSSLVASVTGLSRPDAPSYQVWQLASQLIGLTAATMILVAYNPPRFIRRRLEEKAAPG
jgi:hypothetical protein